MRPSFFSSFATVSAASFFFVSASSDVLWRLPELLGPRAQIFLLLRLRLDLLAEVRQHFLVVIAERPGADRAGAVLAFLEEKLALMPVVGERDLQRLDLGAASWESRTHSVRAASNFFSASASSARRFFISAFASFSSFGAASNCVRRSRIMSSSVASSSHLARERLPAALFAREAVHRLELGAHRQERLDRFAELLHLRLRRRKLGQLPVLTLDVALTRGLVALRHAKVALDALQAIAFDLRLFPLRRELLDRFGSARRF